MLRPQGNTSAVADAPFCCTARRCQTNLGLMHVRGEGVGRDKEEGVRWLKLGAKGGDGLAISTLEKLARIGFA